MPLIITSQGSPTIPLTTSRCRSSVSDGNFSKFSGESTSRVNDPNVFCCDSDSVYATWPPHFDASLYGLPSWIISASYHVRPWSVEIRRFPKRGVSRQQDPLGRRLPNDHVIWLWPRTPAYLTDAISSPIARRSPIVHCHARGRAVSCSTRKT